MSNITIAPNIGSTIGAATDSNQNLSPTKPGSGTQTPPSPATVSGPADNISLSLGAQAAAGSSASPALSDSAASAQSLTLRQQLSNAPLSGTARQNQAIVALLR